MDYYKVLEVEKTADQNQIKKAYKKLALKYHPDRNPGDDEAVSKFKEIAEAFEVLSNPDKKQEYDTYGSVGRKSPYSSPVQDIFDHFFGRGRRPTKRVGRPIFTEHEVDLNFVLKGGKVDVKFKRKDLCSICKGTGGEQGVCELCGGTGAKVVQSGFMTVQTTCDVCRGSGHIVVQPCPDCTKGYTEEKDASVGFTIPAGVEDGMQFQLFGHGGPGPDGPGDLVITVRVKQHEWFQRLREGALLTTVPVSFSQLVQGCSLKVATLDELVDVKIPAGTQSGTKFRLRGKGLPKMYGDRTTYETGDMIVEVKVETPDPDVYSHLLGQIADLEAQHVTPNRAKYLEFVEQKWNS